MGAGFCVVASDTADHLKDGVKSVQMGLGTLVEKPLSTDATQARQLVRTAAEAGQKLYVGCVMRFSESLSNFRQLLPDIARLHAVRIECQSYLPDWRPSHPYGDSYSARPDEGGVLRDLIHEIDYAGWILGWPGSLQARVRNLGRLEIQADEAADLLWECEEGCVVSLRLDYLSRPTRRRMTAYGEGGTLEWDAVEQIVRLHRPGDPVREIRSTQTRDDMFLEQASAFLATGEGGSDTRLASGEDGLKGLAICDAARQARVTRAEEKVVYR